MTPRNGASSSTYSAATNRKSRTRNSTLWTVSFVVMLVNLKRAPEAHSDPHRLTKLGFGLAGAVLIELGAILVTGYAKAAPATVTAAAIPVSGNTEQVGWLLYTSYLIPFEIASMLLLVAMIGAIVLAKREL